MPSNTNDPNPILASASIFVQARPKNIGGRDKNNWKMSLQICENPKRFQKNLFQKCHVIAAKILGVVERILKAPFPKLMCATKDKTKVPSGLETYKVYFILNICVQQIANSK
jgi:hypothetical protein